MKVTTTAFITLKDGDTYLVLDKNKNEIGKLDIVGTTAIVKMNDEDSDNDGERMNELELQNWFDTVHPDFILAHDSPRWIEYNPNPNKNTKANDCSIRAYCAAENLEWDNAYDTACKYGKNLAYMPNDKTAVMHIVEDEFGYTHHKLSKEERGMTVNEFAIKYNKGTYLVQVASHLVAVIDGEYYDSWDSGKKKIKGYFSKS